MKRAILSDIRADLAALEAVLADIAEEGIAEIYCLGDLIGYGTEPRACLEKARSFALNLLGDHEDALLFGAAGFNPQAKASIEWTREQLSLPEQAEKNRELWSFLGRLPKRHINGDCLFVHGSPREPTREYIFYQGLDDQGMLDGIFASPLGLNWKVCFAGHTTQAAGIFIQGRPHRFIRPEEINGPFNPWELEGRVIINVGSVSSMRDGDARPTYVIHDGQQVRFRRLPARYRGEIVPFPFP